MNYKYLYTKPVVNTHLILDRDRRRQKELAVVLLLVMLVGGLLLANTWVRLEFLRVGYEIYDLQVRLEKLRQLQGKLELEEAFLGSPSQIRRRARTELSMEPLDLDRMVILMKP